MNRARSTLGRLWLPFLLTALSAVSYAWIDTGHMVVARIAETRLKPNVKARIAELLKIGADAKTSTMVTMSCYADDYKTQQDGAWHYINYHFRKDGKPVGNTPLQENVVWAIRKGRDALKNKAASQEEQVKAIRYLTHFVGDLHQPMHTVALDSDSYPEGDRGGNLFQIQPIQGWGQRPVANLHALWDFGCGEFQPTDRPLSKDGAAKIDGIAKRIMKQFPEKSFPNLAQDDPERWAKDGFQIATSVCYTLKPGQAVDQAYLSKGRRLAQQRAALAGYRLARLLNDLLG